MNTSDSLNPYINPSVLDDLNALKQDQLLASIDLGSNSFHLAVARLDRGEVRKVLSLSEKVQLAAGLDDNNLLTKDAIKRGLECLARFGQYLDAVPKDKIRIVATNALRKAENRDEFITKANKILPVPVEVIAGREEARLIYLGVSHTNASTDKRLVIDIGGGSTEFIIGKGFDPIETESLQMGCVSYSKKFFADGKITEKAFDDAANATRAELLTIEKRYKKVGWDNAIGSSGTVKACHLAIIELGFDERGVSLEGMKKLRKYLISLGSVDKIALAGVKPHRQAVFPAGVAELHAIMKTLGIKRLGYSDGALREGVMYDMLGRKSQEDVKDRSVLALMDRYTVSRKQGVLVATTAISMAQDNAQALGIGAGDIELLRHTAMLHEIGLAVSHSNYHKHSSYLLRHSDIFGFSQSEQQIMGEMTLHHRRKLKDDGVGELKKIAGAPLIYLCLILRLSALAHQSRSRHSAKITLKATPKTWQVHVGQGNHRELIISQLTSEIAQFAKWGVKLVVLQ